MKKHNNILTLQDLSGIINKQIEKAKLAPSKTWGFSRLDIIMNLKQIMKEAEEICLDNC